MTVCTGRGADGDHCCYIGGKVCRFLDTETVRCTMWDKMHHVRWKKAPVGKWFAERYPGYTCQDWPQNIPEVMEAEPDAGPFYACCWGRGNNGNVGS